MDAELDRLGRPIAIDEGVRSFSQSRVKDRVRKSSYLQLCMQSNFTESNFRVISLMYLSKNESGSLCRRLPVDIERSSCVIVKEISVDGLKGASLYTLYTNVFDAVTLFHGAEAETVCRVELAEKSKSKKVPSLQHASSSLKK
ncbi:hypothetical protein Tco_0882095 [Tanacetum coccineum]